MAARFEHKPRSADAPCWVGKYRNLHNLPHWHLEHELITCRGGTAELTLDGTTVTLQPGMAAFCPAGTVHRIDAQEQTTLLVCQIAPEPVRTLEPELSRLPPCFPDGYGLNEGLEQVLEELTAQRPHYTRYAAALLTGLLIRMLRSEPLSALPAGKPDRRVLRSIAQYQALLAEIDANSEFLTFADAAAHMNMSQAHFSRFFKSCTGMVFSEYLNLVKIDKAIAILRSDPRISTSDLALKCGFNTLRSFNRVFRKVTGCSPRQLPPDFTLPIRRYDGTVRGFDPTLADTITLTVP